ncbi:MAG: RNA-binding domain-containing protein [Candidatus Caldatribacteriota bacterium]|jgi:ATP-dependent DNA helicase RecG
MLTKKELIDKINGIEWEDIEIKKAEYAVPKNSWDTVSAFANTMGGYLIFGISQINDKFKITGVSNPEKVHSDFITTLRSEKFNIALSAKCDKKVFQEGTVLIYYIPEMPRQVKPIYYDDNIRNTFIRYGGTDQRAKDKEIEKFLREASESSSDSMVFEEATIEDLRQDSINYFLNLYKNYSQDKNNLSFNGEELLIRKGFLKKSKDSSLKITAAAILLFGTDNALVNYFPFYKIDYFEIPGTNWGGIEERRWEHRIRSESNLFETYQMIIPRLRIRIPIPFMLKKDSVTRDDNPPSIIAIREAFINLLSHADYFDRKGSSIKVYDDRIEFFNGGSLLFDEKLVEEGDISEPRNPLIINAFRMVHLAEDAGSGFYKIFSNWKEAGFSKPLITSNRRENYFRINFLFQPISEKASKKHQFSTKLAPSWHQVSTKLALSWDQVQKILEKCEKPKFLTEIMESMEWKDRTKFRKKFIHPLLSEKLIKMTIPDKPQSPNQQYVTTEKGLKLLKEMTE